MMQSSDEIRRENVDTRLLSLSRPILRDAAFAAPQDEIVRCGALSPWRALAMGRSRRGTHQP